MHSTERQNRSIRAEVREWTKEPAFALVDPHAKKRSPRAARKSYVASLNVTEARKAKLVEDLDRFYRWKRIPFEKPNYRRIERLPFIPLESEVDQLIPPPI